MITLSVFYYLYLLVLLFFIIYSLFNIYHLLRFGFASFTNALIIIAYLIVATIVIMSSFNLLMTINWQTPLLNLPSNFLGNGNINF